MRAERASHLDPRVPDAFLSADAEIERIVRIGTLQLH